MVKDKRLLAELLVPQLRRLLAVEALCVTHKWAPHQAKVVNDVKQIQ